MTVDWITNEYAMGGGCWVFVASLGLSCLISSLDPRGILYMETRAPVSDAMTMALRRSSVAIMSCRLVTQKVLER